jgi:hypothetical protein
MRLAVTLPDSWKRQVVGPRVLAQVEPGIEFEVAPIAELPEDVTDWSLKTPHRDKTNGVEKVEVNRSLQDTSELGWPLVVHESQGFDGAGTLLQMRVHVLFVLGEHCSMIAIRGTDASRFSARRDELLAIARTGRPEWGEPVGASLEDLLAT